MVTRIHSRLPCSTDFEGSCQDPLNGSLLSNYTSSSIRTSLLDCDEPYIILTSFQGELMSYESCVDPRNKPPNWSIGDNLLANYWDRSTSQQLGFFNAEEAERILMLMKSFGDSALFVDDEWRDSFIFAPFIVEIFSLDYFSTCIALRIPSCGNVLFYNCRRTANPGKSTAMAPVTAGVCSNGSAASILGL